MDNDIARTFKECMLWSESLIRAHNSSFVRLTKRGNKLYKNVRDMVLAAFNPKDPDRLSARKTLRNIAATYKLKEQPFNKDKKRYWIKVMLFSFAMYKSELDIPVTYSEYGMGAGKKNCKRKKKTCHRHDYIAYRSSSPVIYTHCHIISVPFGGMNKRY